MVVTPAVVISPTTVGTPVVPMIRVVMSPGGVMPGKVSIVDAAVMSEGPTSPRPVMGAPRGRVMGMRAMCMRVMPVPAVSVRSVTAMPVPAMTAAGEGRSLRDQTDDHRQSNQVQISHDSSPFC
jgi:hypothetical protein